MTTTTTAVRTTRAEAAATPAGAGEQVWDDARRFYQPKFPPAAMLAATAQALRTDYGIARWPGYEGSRARIAISAGTVGIGYRNVARREKTGERATERRRDVVDELAAELGRTGEFPTAPVPRRVIKTWSAKSRANMWQGFHQLEYEPFFRRGDVPAMVTLTYPGDWLTVAPNGRASKRHLWLFRKRFARAWGFVLRAIWKLEFQRRGAPHYHLMLVPPHGKARRGRYAGMTFREWLSHTWADIVAHPDPGERARHIGAGTRIDYADGLKATTPYRVASYFSKHGSFRAKEYQNIVPREWQGAGDGPGRFWGYWNLRRVVHGVELEFADATLIARTLRRLARAKGVTHSVGAPRYAGGKLAPAVAEIVGLAGAQELGAQPAPSFRSVRRRVRRMRGRFGAGWISSHDGAKLAGDLARYLAKVHGPPPEPGPVARYLALSRAPT